MKRFLFVISFIAFFFGAIAVSGVYAQKSKKIFLKWGRGEAGRAVAGKAASAISGNQYFDLKFQINESRGVDIGIYPSPEDVALVFDIIGPNGKVLHKNIGDFLDELTEPGIYTIRVHFQNDVPIADRSKTTKFTVTVFMYV